MLPYSNNFPALFFQLFSYCPVSFYIFSYFVFPKNYVGLWLDIMFWASVPETAVNENSYFIFFIGKIRFSDYPFWLIGKTQKFHYSFKHKFGLCFYAPNH